MRKRSLLRRWAIYYFIVSAMLWAVFVGAGATFLIPNPSGTEKIKLVLFGLVMVASFGLLGWVLWYPTGKRIQSIARTVKAYANGDFNPRLPSHDACELSVLSAELNWMAQQFHDRMLADEHRKQEQEAVLSSMAEGVIAVDTDERLIKINRAAREWLNLKNVALEGKAVSEILRQADLQRFIRIALASKESMKADIELQGRARRQLQVSSSELKGESGRRMGVLIVINDLTHVRRLENLRRDFVANVSHELKTPITSIKGFMETLLDGAIDDPEAARRFLEIIAKQADRLDAIIEDLLSLSRIEQESERGELATQLASVNEVINAALMAMQPRAEGRQIALSANCPYALKARINAPLLEQAITNLVDNAIKYSEDGTAVSISAREEAGRAIVEVKDQGPGIAKEHQARIFERFYRVDKSRSRRLGGTGLGLSIVKHIVQAHGGQVCVKSMPDQGSTFIIKLPQ